MARKRILFLAEGATMAHFVRPLVLAEALDPECYEIHFYAPARYTSYLCDKPFSSGELSSMPGEQFLANIARGRPLFPTDVLRAYVNQERELIARIRPDLVIGDLRLSLPISARLEKVPHGVIFNAYWSPYAARRVVVPSLPITRILPPGLLAPLFQLIQPLAFGIHVGPANRVRKEFGVPPLPPDVRVMYTEGTYALYPDVPEFAPTSGLPAHHRYVGICPWNPPISKPAWWDAMRAQPKPKVIVALGSSGPLRVLPALFRALARLPVSVVIATSGRTLPDLPPGALTADLLPLSEAATLAGVVVSHGGSSGFYPAIAAGTPVLGIPSNADQHQATAVLAESGAGLGVRSENASEANLLRALEQLLFDPRFREAAQKWAAIFARYPTDTLFRDFISETLG